MAKHITPVVLAVIKKGNKYLLTKRVETEESEFHDLWQIPGGGLEFGEKIEDCVDRECHEELNATVAIVKLLPKIFHRVYKDRWHGIFLSFLCTLNSEEKDIQLNEEASEWRWYSFAEIQKLNAFPLLKEIVVLAEAM